MAIVLECVSGPPKGKRIEVVAGKPLPFKIKKHDQDAGAVVVEVVDGQLVMTNRSQLPCLVNGESRPRSVLRNGDELVIGKNAFKVEIAEVEAGATQQLDRLELDVAPPPQLCSVCDGVFVAQQGWSDGEHRICRRCLVKGVRPDHLPRTDSAPTVPAPTFESAETKVVTRDAAPAAKSDSGSRHPMPQQGDAGSRHAAPSSSDSGGHKAADDRHAKRISASRLSAIESEESPGILKKVTSMLGGHRADRQRLDSLEQERGRLLVEAGRLSLGSGGGLGLPEQTLVALLSGRKVTVDPLELSRILMLDTEIAALRRALGLGADASAILMPAPALRPEMKEQKERAFHTLDAMATEDLGETTADAPTTAATRPAPAPAPVVAKPNSSSGRRRHHRR
jgi:hypothetical protein